jgi:coenzyme Q-binding protein COQ10
MTLYRERRLFPIATERLYELVANVERYPEFIPGWRKARVLERTGNEARVEQTLGLAGFQMRFTSRAFFDPPRRLQIRAEDGPFRRLAIDWRFEPSEGGCRVELQVEFESGSRRLDRMARALLGPMGRRVMGAFESRARRLLG